MHTQSHMYTTRKYTHTCRTTCSHMHAQMHARTHMHVHTNACTHTRTHMHVKVHSIHTEKYIHMYNYTNTHTYTTYIHAKGGSQTRPFTCTHLRWRVNHRNRSEVAVADSKHDTDDNGCQITLKDRSVEGARDNAKCKEWKEDKSEKNKDKDGSPVLRLHQGREGESTCKLGSHT